MADAAQIAALAERVEKLDGPDIGVDWDIGWALGEWINLGGWWREHKKTGDRERFSPSMGAPTYTASLDAAMTLVPEGWSFSIIVFPEGHANAAILEFRQQNVSGELKLIHRSNMADSGRVQSATPALALTAAALRARSQEPSDGE